MELFRQKEKNNWQEVMDRVLIRLDGYFKFLNMDNDFLKKKLLMSLSQLANLLIR